MLILLLGHTNSGTSFLLENTNYKVLKEFTTRKKRFETESGYYFLTEEELKDYKDFILYKVDYQVVDPEQPIYSYGLFKDEVIRAINSEDIYVLRTNYEVYEHFKKHNIVFNKLIVLQCTNYNLLYERMSKRDNFKETVRRYFSDLEKLKTIKSNKNIFFLESDDNVIDNFKKIVSEGVTNNEL